MNCFSEKCILDKRKKIAVLLLLLPILVTMFAGCRRDDHEPSESETSALVETIILETTEELTTRILETTSEILVTTTDEEIYRETETSVVELNLETSKPEEITKAVSNETTELIETTVEPITETTSEEETTQIDETTEHIPPETEEETIPLRDIGITANQEDKWIITSHEDWSGSQGMFYTIYNGGQDKLVVVDGGNVDNIDHVRRVINELGGHVNAWIVTHYHPDHVDAFNFIYSDLQGIVVDAVYDSPMDWGEYQSVAQWWDGAGSFATYLEITKNSDAIHHLNRGDFFTIGDIRFDVLNSYDDDSEKYGDIPNNASLVFKVSGNSQSMLFCADVHSQGMGKMLADTYGDLLKSDFLQSGHHGNNSYDMTFYDTVSPSYVFMDAPAWLMYGEGYKTLKLINWCEENGVEYHGYPEAPNSIELR